MTKVILKNIIIKEKTTAYSDNYYIIADVNDEENKSYYVFKSTLIKINFSNLKDKPQSFGWPGMVSYWPHIREVEIYYYQDNDLPHQKQKWKRAREITVLNKIKIKRKDIFI